MGNRKAEVLRKEKTIKKNRSAMEIAREAQEKYARRMEGVKTILVPHPTIPKLWIEKIVKE